RQAVCGASRPLNLKSRNYTRAHRVLALSFQSRDRRAPNRRAIRIRDLYLFWRRRPRGENRFFVEFCSRGLSTPGLTSGPVGVTCPGRARRESPDITPSNDRRLARSRSKPPHMDFFLEESISKFSADHRGTKNQQFRE